jgi:hypothetical protein
VEVLCANRSAAHWVHRDSRVWSSFKAHARDIFDPPFTRSDKRPSSSFLAQLLFRVPSLVHLAVHLAMLGFTCPWVSFPLRDITRARLRLFAEPPTLHFVPSAGFHNLSTASSALELAGLFHPAATSRVLYSFRGFSPSAADLLQQKIRFLPAVVSPPLVPALRLSPAHVHVRERCLSASRPCSAPGRVPQVRLFTSPKAAPLFEFHAPPGPCSLDAGLRSHGCRPLMTLRVRSSRPRRSFDDRSPAHLRGVTFHVRPGKQRGDPRAVLQARCLALSSGIASERSSASIASHLTALRFMLTAHSVTAMAELACVRGPDPSFGRIERRVTARHLSVMRARGVTARSSSRSFSRSSSGVADRCIPCGTLPHRSAVFRVPRILSDTRAARIRVRLTAAAAGFGSSTPWCSSAARHARLSTITIAPVRSPSRWSRSRTVSLFSPFGAENPFCVHSRFGVHPSSSCSLTLR